MTIDEAIVECKQNDLYQYAEWLEELKAFRNNKYTAYYYNKGYSKAENDYHKQSENDRQSAYELGYINAIDDFKKELFKNSERARPAGWSRYSEIVTCEKIYDIAEQLKVGGKNES